MYFFLVAISVSTEIKLRSAYSCLCGQLWRSSSLTLLALRSRPSSSLELFTSLRLGAMAGRYEQAVDRAWTATSLFSSHPSPLLFFRPSSKASDLGFTVSQDGAGVHDTRMGIYDCCLNVFTLARHVWSSFDWLSNLIIGGRKLIDTNRTTATAKGPCEPRRNAAMVNC